MALMKIMSFRRWYLLLNKWWMLLVAIVIVTIVTLFMIYLTQTPTKEVDTSFRNSQLSDEVRIDNLLAQMTLKEKIGQMTLVERNSVKELEHITSYGFGGLLSGSGSKPEDNTAVGWKKMILEYQSYAQISRLGIPLLYGSDAIHGHAHMSGATVFPHAIGLGAAGDETLVEEIGRATALELVASGVNWNFAPNLDLPTDIRWGRVYETFSDDVGLASTLGSAYVRGLQTPLENTSRIPVIATLKHYLGLGAMQWQTSTNENFKIDQGVTLEDKDALYVEYLPAFEASVSAGALSVMVGLNTYGNKKIIINKHLLTDVLKEEVGFKGFVVSDWYGVHERRTNKFLATIQAINAGVDMVMLPFDYETFVRHMVWANRLGFISDERIDDAVKRILRAKIANGLFDEVQTESLPVATGSDEHRALARSAVAKSLVLLKNEEDVLPIADNVAHIRVAGSAADNVGVQSGAWTIEWQGIDGNWLPGSTSILAGIKARVSRNTLLEYSETGDFDGSNKTAEIGIAIVGEKPYAEGWGDREYPILSDDDLNAIEKLKESSERVVVVIVSGRPLLVSDEIQNWNALVAAWLPGNEGAGVADGLFGDTPFTGKLPVAWPRTSEQLPISSNGITSDGSSLLYPRGFGL